MIYPAQPASQRHFSKPLRVDFLPLFDTGSDPDRVKTRDAERIRALFAEQQPAFGTGAGRAPALGSAIAWMVPDTGRVYGIVTPPLGIVPMAADFPSLDRLHLRRITKRGEPP